MKKVIIILSIVCILFLIFLSQNNSEDPIDHPREENPSDIVVSSPVEDEAVGFPLVVSGEARGTRFFEGSFPVRIIGEDGRVLLETYAEAHGEWMTQDFVPYSVRITDLQYEKGEVATIILRRANPGDVPRGDESHYVYVELPDPDEYQRLDFYWTDAAAIQQGAPCDKLIRSTRLIERNDQMIASTLQALLSGPSQQETLLGATTSIPTQAEMLSSNLEEGLLEIEFTEALDRGIGGSCLVTSIRSQIQTTLEQFTEVESVELRIGDRGDGEVLQP